MKKHLKNNDACERNIITYTTADETYMLRKKIIKQSSGSVYIAGTTLKDAFSTADSNREISIIWDLMQNEKIDHVYIFILNYKYIGINQETASNEIEITLTNIMDAVLKQERKCPEVQIILLNNFSMPFELITNSKFLTRSTYVFDYSRQYRGQYLLFDSDDLEYRSAKKYLDLLIKNAYEIDMTSQPSYRDIVKQKYCCDMISYQMRGLKIKKINSTQFKNIVKASFTNATNADIGTQNKIDYFCIPNQDQTQRVLLPYLRETEVLLNKLVKIHDKEYGWAKIIPCNDLGFPNNVVRIAGGFLTGAYYNWSCAVPIVPIDATINTCTSSVFELNKFDADAMDNETFEVLVRKVCAHAMESGYAFAFESGNHFLMISKDDSGRYYLVMHCSAKQAKESCFGLYPSERVWYKDKIKILYNDRQDRYIRYIRSDTAVRFVDYANRFRDFNQEMHRYIAEEFAAALGTEIVGNPIIKHHYGMPSPTSIAIGTFAIDTMSNNSDDLKGPVFSELGNDICIFSLSRTQSKTYTPSGTNQKIVLVPHGWGQIIDHVQSVRVENVSDEKYRQLVIETTEAHRFEVTPQNRISIPEKRVRQFDSVDTFMNNKCQNISGEILKKLHPVYCFCSRTVQTKKFKFNTDVSSQS